MCMVLYSVTPYSGYWRFEGTCCICIQERRESVLKMEVVGSCTLRDYRCHSCDEHSLVILWKSQNAPFLYTIFFKEYLIQCYISTRNIR
jgi:hypothetical protein